MFAEKVQLRLSLLVVVQDMAKCDAVVGAVGSSFEGLLCSAMVHEELPETLTFCPLSALIHIFPPEY